MLDTMVAHLIKGAPSSASSDRRHRRAVKAMPSSTHCARTLLVFAGLYSATCAPIQNVTAGSQPESKGKGVCAYARSCVGRCAWISSDTPCNNYQQCETTYPKPTYMAAECVFPDEASASAAVAETLKEEAPLLDFRSVKVGDTCTGPHESCCGAPGGDVHNCPASARTSDCDKKKACCCG